MLSQQEVLGRFIAKHGNRFDYSRFVYEKTTVKSWFGCPDHGWFQSTPTNHLKTTGGCKKCRHILIGKKRALTQNEAIKRFERVHQGKGYSYNSTIYISTNKKVQVICPKHGPFWILPSHHFKGVGCGKCGREKIKRPRLTQKEVLERCLATHGKDKFDYTRLKYEVGYKKIEIGCNSCGGWFFQSAHSHFSGQGCPYCAGHLKGSNHNFIKKAQKIHLSFYLYHKSNITNAKTPIIITCPIHGDFKQTPTAHLQGRGCSKCGRQKITDSLRLSRQDFIRRAEELYGDYYSYEHLQYQSSMQKVSITCPKHGVFEKRPVNFLRGSGCVICMGRGKLNTKTFIQKAIEVHGESNYSYEFVQYENSKKKVDIVCHVHGAFSQQPDAHLSGSGCPSCGKEKASRSKTRSNSEVIKLCIATHGTERFDYSDTVFSHSGTKIKVRCKSCKRTFKTLLDNHIRKKAGCPHCRQSSGEITIMKWLNKNKITCVEQMRFNDCRNVSMLPFDFYLHNYGLLIEYQGKQHYHPIKFFGGQEGLEYRQKNDQIKRNFVNSRPDLELLEIRYDQKKQIPQILEIELEKRGLQPRQLRLAL